jgi:hypothetical protein
MLRVLLLILLTWFLYNLVFKFIIPVYNTTREMKQKFREMQNRMQDPVNQQHDNSNTAAAAPKSSSKATREDYIDFEEIK